MKNLKKYNYFLVLFFLVLVFTTTTRASDTIIERDGVLYAGEGWTTWTNGLQLVYFSGNPTEIGRQHGLLILKHGGEEIKKLGDELKNQMLGSNELVSFFKDFYARSMFVPAFKRHMSEENIQELEGISTSLGDSFNENMYQFIMSNAGQDLALTMGCSIFAAWNAMTTNGKLIVVGI